MGARSIGSLTLVIGLVTIPVKLYTATSENEVSFRRLDRSTGARVKQLLVSEADGRELKSEDIIQAYQHEADEYVTFEPDELKAITLEGAPDRLLVTEVVPAAELDPVHVAKSTWLAPDEGANRAYHLFASVLAHRGQMLIGHRGVRLRDSIVVVQPHRSGEGLVMHDIRYVDEVRVETLRDVVPNGVVMTSLELGLANRLLDGLAKAKLDLSKYVDGGGERLKAAVKKKLAGNRIELPPPATAPGEPIDLLAQLRASVMPPAKAARAGARRAAAS